MPNEFGSVLEISVRKNGTNLVQMNGSLLWFNSSQLSKNGILVEDTEVN